MNAGASFCHCAVNVCRSPLPAANHGVRFRFLFPLLTSFFTTQLSTKREIETEKRLTICKPDQKSGRQNTSTGAHSSRS